MKFTALAVAVALATSSVIAADTPALRALTDATATDDMQPTAVDAPNEGNNQKEMGWGWGRPGWGHGWGRPWGHRWGWGHRGWGW